MLATRLGRGIRGVEHLARNVCNKERRMSPNHSLLLDVLINRNRFVLSISVIISISKSNSNSNSNRNSISIRIRLALV